MNGRGGGGFNSRGSNNAGGTSSWADGGDKGYLGGLGKYNKKESSGGAGLLDPSSAFANAAPFSYNPQTNSITPNYLPAAPASAGVPTSAPFGQPPFVPYQNGAGAGVATGYPGFQQPGVQFPPQPVFYAAPPPPPGQ